MKILQNQELQKLPTHRLLALYRKTFRHMKSLYADVTDYGTAPEFLEDTNDDRVKLCVELNVYCDDMKTLLDDREHVLRGR